VVLRGLQVPRQLRHQLGSLGDQDWDRERKESADQRESDDYDGGHRDPAGEVVADQPGHGRFEADGDEQRQSDQYQHTADGDQGATSPMVTATPAAPAMPTQKGARRSQGLPG
jgi:hypothetical protein